MSKNTKHNFDKNDTATINTNSAILINILQPLIFLGNLLFYKAVTRLKN